MTEMFGWVGLFPNYGSNEPQLGCEKMLRCAEVHKENFLPGGPPWVSDATWRVG